jgi:cell division protein FtsI/penicillin-binding protein 2
VVREGTGQLARVPGFRTAGKTGTAQRAVAGTFDDEHHVAWFAGFLPMPDPRLVIVVAVEDPSLNDFWASTVAAPIFADIAEASVSLLGFPPTEEVSIPGPQLARREGSATEDDA